MDELKQSKPTSWEDMAHDGFKRDRLEHEISEAKKSKRNWEKIQDEHNQEREGGGDGRGSSGSGG